MLNVLKHNDGQYWILFIYRANFTNAMKVKEIAWAYLKNWLTGTLELAQYWGGSMYLKKRLLRQLDII